MVIVIFLLNSSSNKKAQTTAGTANAPSGPVTNSTVGSTGIQAGAGTDQELANLSQITQGGFSQIQQNEKVQTGLLAQLTGNMNGIGSPMSQFGGAIQTTQTGAAQNNATASATGQPVENASNSNSDSMVPTSVHG